MPLYANNGIPGPGSYLSSEYNNTGVQISLGMSRKIEEKNENPGPGSYNPNTSQILKRPQTAKIGKSQRFYKIKTEASDNFYDSKMKNETPKYSFTRKKKL